LLSKPCPERRSSHTFGAEQRRVGVAEPGGSQFGGEGVEPAGEHRLVGVPQLDHEDGAGVADDELAVLRLLAIFLGAVEDRLVDQLAAGGPRVGRPVGPHDEHRGPQGLVHRAAVHAQQRPRRRHGDHVELVFHAEEQRALGAGDQPAEVERPRARGIEARGVHQGVERVAGVPPGDLGPGERVADQLPVGRVAEQVAELAIDAGLERVRARALGGELRGRERPEGDLRAVGQEAAGRDQMVASGAPGDRVGAAGVVAHHATDHRPGGGRCFRREEQAVAGEKPVELVADHARLDADTAVRHVERQDPVHVPAGVDDDPRTDDLAGQRRSRRPGYEPDPLGSCEADELAHVVLSGGEGDPQRTLLVLGGVGRVDRPGDVVEPQLAGEASGKCPETVGHGGGRGGSEGHRHHLPRNPDPIQRAGSITWRSAAGPARRAPAPRRCGEP
jgi:hypothetical protein